MTYLVIPDDIKLFILHKIDSVAHLEGLLLLRSNPEKEWDATTLSNHLYISQTQAAELLNHLADQGFATVSQQRYRYQPSFAEQQVLIDRVAEVYKQYLVPITNLIHAKSKNKIQAFADAFKLRKD